MDFKLFPYSEVVNEFCGLADWKRIISVIKIFIPKHKYIPYIFVIASVRKNLDW